MARKTVLDLDLSGIETPVYLIDLGILRKNLEVLAGVQERAGCKILMALKGFAFWPAAPLIMQYLSGVAASSLNEARLGREEFKKAVHTYAPAYMRSSFEEVLSYSDHLVFNSPSQYERFLPLVKQHDGASEKQLGIRVNPEHREVSVAMYDPCAPGSRLGATREQLSGHALSEISGLHFHTLCQMNAAALERTLGAVEDRFGELLKRVSWVNFGGGHHITRPDYDVDLLVTLIRDFKQRHGVEVYLEPGEAIALNAGILVASVLDVVDNAGKTAILDTSASAHMPDVLEMPYRPEIVGAREPAKLGYTHRLGGLTCLAGDVIGEYSFERPLEPGDKLVFLDMAHYTMVKNTTFNGVGLPSIGTYEPNTDRVEMIRRFGYEDYRNRLG